MNKNNYNQHKTQTLEKVRWLSILFFFLLSCFVKYYLYNIQLFIRIFIVSFCICCAIGTFLYTKQGQCIFSYIIISKQEMNKIIWPKYKETFYTTLIIISVTIFISLILWCIDSIIFRLIYFIINTRF